MKRLLYFVLLALTPALATAFGLGNLDLNSALNEPLDGRIQLLSPTADELDSLKISLADSDAFARAKIDRPFILSKLRFDLRRSDNDGPDYIRVYSQEPIREPFLNFLIEVSWSNGRLFREYTVLLDPPLYDPNVRSAEFAQAPEAKTESSTPVTVAEPEPAVTDNEAIAPSSPTNTADVSYSGGDYGPTSSSDTLWSIASEMRPDSSISVNKMMMALLRANPDAFIDGNINGLKRGQILRMPNESEINALSNAEALEEAQSQYSAWGDIRENLSSNVSERPEVSSSTEIEVVETKVVEEETVDAELKLVSADDSGEASDQVSSVDSGTGEEMILAQETIQVLTQENLDLKDRVQESEALLSDLKRLLSLKDDELAALQEQIVAAQAGEEVIAETEETATDIEEAILAEVEGEAVTDIEEEILAEDEVAETEEEIVAEADAEEEIEVIETEPEPASTGAMGMVEQYLGPVKDILFGNPVIGMAIAGVILLLIIIVVIMKFRKPKVEVDEDETIKVDAMPEGAFPDFDSGDMGNTGEESAVDEEAETVLPDSEDETVTPPDTNDVADSDLDEAAAAQSVEEAPAIDQIEEEEEDPLQEVNTYLAFEQFDQAEEFVRNVINDSPDNPEYHTKLLEVFYTSGDKKSYEEEAKVLHDLVGGEGEYWNMATAMWSEMSPNRALFEAGEDDEDDTADNTSGGFVDVTADEEAGDDTGGLDFDIGGTEEAATEEASAAEEMLDITGASSEEVLDMTAAEEAEDLLDVTAAVNIDDEINSEAETLQANDSDDILDISGAGAENLLDNTSEEDSLSDDLLDVTAAANLDLDSEEDLLDVTAATSAGADSSDLLDLDTGDVELDITADNSIDSEAETNEIEFDITAEDDAAVDIDASATEELSAESSDDSNVLDFDMTAADNDSNELELDIGAIDSEAETNEIQLDIPDSSDEEPALEVALDEPEEAIRLDVEESSDEMSLDMDLSIAEPEAGADEIELDIPVSSDEEPALEIDIEDSATEDDLSLEIDFDDDSTTEKASSGVDEGIELDLSIGEDEPEAEVAATEEDNAGDNLGIDLDFTLDDDSSETAEESSLDLDGTVELPKNALSLDEADDDDDEGDPTVFVPRAAQPDEQSSEDEIATKLDLAKAYVELGDKDSAKTILDEVMADGNDEQRKQAEDLLGQV
ncbi:MAG: FimV/HubP family polar landmark protein [Gammaproteobacteria bacterium]